MRELTRGAEGGPVVPDDRADQHYFDRTFERAAVKILPGEFFVSRDKMLVTVLGSCVAACILDGEAGLGGMNHFMLPDASGDVIGRSARYGAFAMEVLINELIKSGARRHALRAKVFGGGRVMSLLGHSQVGERNAQFVLDYLSREGIPVLAQDLLDVHARKVYFFPQGGRVLMKKLARTDLHTLARREQAYREKLVHEDASGDIELFT
ncbi:chemoreceptor glutamine deamidase CheD [Methyloversatilis thermotolerans]|uniref:chemoreceptor glutamine deamidase CheD n=1 Tax=Methyloversatilis thermotolerans TaxID=1346290 RepID=UPI00036A37F3|nr:chemoreceptor glutamine deamidase CheD [Methyloversatilis thermotolerans]